MSFESRRKGDLETTSKVEVRMCWRKGDNKGMSAAKIAQIYSRSQVLDGWGDKSKITEHLGDVEEQKYFRNEWEMYRVG